MQGAKKKKTLVKKIRWEDLSYQPSRHYNILIIPHHYLVQEQTKRSLEQRAEPRDRRTRVWILDLRETTLQSHRGSTFKK